MVVWSTFNTIQLASLFPVWIWLYKSIALNWCAFDENSDSEFNPTFASVRFFCVFPECVTMSECSGEINQFRLYLDSTWLISYKISSIPFFSLSVASFLSPPIDSRVFIYWIWCVHFEHVLISFRLCLAHPKIYRSSLFSILDLLSFDLVSFFTFSLRMGFINPDMWMTFFYHFSPSLHRESLHFVRVVFIFPICSMLNNNNKTNK